MITPTELFNQSNKLSTALLPELNLFLPDFILAKVLFNTSTYSGPLAASILLKFSSLNISSTLSCHFSKCLALIPSFKFCIKSVVIVPESQAALGFTYPTSPFNAINSVANSNKSLLFLTKSTISFLSELVNPGISIPCVSHI